MLYGVERRTAWTVPSARLMQVKTHRLLLSKL